MSIVYKTLLIRKCMRAFKSEDEVIQEESPIIKWELLQFIVSLEFDQIRKTFYLYA